MVPLQDTNFTVCNMICSL